MAVAGSGGLVARVEAAGFRAFATSPARHGDGAAPTRDLTPLPPVDARAAEVEFAENFADKGARRHATAIQEHIRAWRPDVVVRDEADLGSADRGRGARASRRRPSWCWPPGMLDAARPRRGRRWPPCGPSTACRRIPACHAHARPGAVAVPAVVPQPASPVPLPETTFSFRPGDAWPRAHAPSSVRKRVYVTLGTVFNSGSGDLFERLLAGLAEVDADVLVTVGRDLDPAVFGPQPEHVRVERFVPQADVLPDRGPGGLARRLREPDGHAWPTACPPCSSRWAPTSRTTPGRAEELGLARTLDAATATPGDDRPERRTRPSRTTPPSTGRARWRTRSTRCPASRTVPLLEAMLR